MNTFEYFSDIEERFQKRRGTLLMLSTLDWALIDMWREAGVPLEAVLRGIDHAFDKHDAKSAKSRTRTRKVNGLAWCAQAVMEATEQMREAAAGLDAGPTRPQRESGFEAERVAAFLEANRTALLAADVPVAAAASRDETAQRLAELAASVRSDAGTDLAELDRTLSVIEERMVAALMQAASEEELLALRSQAEREIAPYRARMAAVQLKQVQQNFLLKRLLEARRLPRLSLFYMGHA
jgi:hypothetical protein